MTLRLYLLPLQKNVVRKKANIQATWYSQYMSLVSSLVTVISFPPMPPQQREKKFPGTDKRDSRFQAVTKEILLKSQLIFTGRNLDTCIQGKKNIELNLSALAKAFPRSGWS